MADLAGTGGKITATITVTRKATGLTEQYQLESFANEEQARALGLLPPKPEVDSSGEVDV